MKCPYCGYKESKVIDSRPAEEGSSIRRRRECLSCAKRFTTYETVESLPMVVIKKDGSRQSFDKSKLINGMVRACDKRKVPLPVLEKIADEIEQELQNSLEREVSTVVIGEKVMEKLKKVFTDHMLNDSDIPEDMRHSKMVSLRICYFAGGIVNLYKQWFRGDLDCTLNDIAMEVSKLLQLEAKELFGE